MPLRDDLLNPIPGDNPGGESLWYSPIYDKIKEARRSDDDAPQGDWEHERKSADWNIVIKLAGEALATKSKDVQLAAWLTEAMLKKEGYAGLCQGLELLRGLLDNFWDNLYPALEDGDAELRATPLDWVGSTLNSSLKLVPITRKGELNWFQFKESRAVGSEADTGGEENKVAAYRQAVQDGKITKEMWEEAFKATPKSFYRETVQTLDQITATLDSLNDVCQQKFPNATPSFSSLRSTIEEVRHTVNSLLQEKRKLEPDEDAPPDEQAAEESTGEGRKPLDALAWGEEGRGPGVGPPDAAAYRMAIDAARTGRHQEALSILTRALLAERCGRHRFERKTQIAQICVETGHESIALPILEELASEIDKRNLEDWESPDVIARPLALLYRCMVKFERDEAERAKLYARICRLSPLEAFSCTR